MAKQSLLLSAFFYGLLITTVLGRESDRDSCSWWAIGAGVLIGGGAIMTAPLVLPAVGSFAASIQGPVIASGSYFALAQSAGAAGLAVSTKVVIGTVAGAAGHQAYAATSGCKNPDCK